MLYRGGSAGEASKALKARGIVQVGRAPHRKEWGQPEWVDHVRDVIRWLRCSVQTEQGYVDEVRYTIASDLYGFGRGPWKAPGCAPTTAIVIDTTPNDAGFDIKLPYDETSRRNETPGRQSPSWATVGCRSAVAAANRRATADWILLSSSITTYAPLLQKGLQSRQDFIDHLIRHVLYEPCGACGIVDGSRLVAHHNALRFRACVH